MTAYITKYALTRGIIEVDKLVFNPFTYDMIFEGNKIKVDDWTTDLEHAKIIADNMRHKQIAKLSEQIEILKSKTF